MTHYIEISINGTMILPQCPTDSLEYLNALSNLKNNDLVLIKLTKINPSTSSSDLKILLKLITGHRGNGIETTLQQNYLIFLNELTILATIFNYLELKYNINENVNVNLNN